ncbi:uncharacterized protein LOC111260785 [Varroa jacobsoni]|uniref:Uncharacterized protein n=1 Tax=Varroa destructor TaxID=109461 RepID=A0A7M7L4F7_VARDE|nr:uncharacterized protein LOC111253979 isoform X2 [Varroa destructor]XP_022689522.1 uncharacterized protein LOC111260785 [Varroa jacobsoni]
MNPLYVLTVMAGAVVAQYSDPASHGFTINAPGLTNTATFGYGSGLSSGPATRPAAAADPVARPAVARSYVPLSSSNADPQVTLTQRSFTLSNVGSVGGPTGSVIGERRLLTSSNAVLPRQQTGAGVPAGRQLGGNALGTTVVTLSSRGPGGAPAPLSNYYGGAAGGRRLVSSSGAVGGSPFNPTIQREPSRFQYAPPQARGNFAPSHGYTVNAPGFTKHKTFAGPAVHGTNQAFLHASSG